MPAVKPPGSDKPKHPIDVLVGRKIQERRLHLGLTLDGLANKTRINPQLIGAFEQATRHIQVWRLYRIAKALNCDIIWFFHDLEIGGDTDAQDR
jgi:transcriptional regulator with XRE-family HTH domain